MMKRHTFCMKTAACVLALAACACAGARGPLRVAFVGDPQVDNETELGYARASIYRELRERGDLDLVIILGDLVNDDVRLLARDVQRRLDHTGKQHPVVVGGEYLSRLF